MIYANPKNGIKPRISPKAYIAPNATIIGDVIIEAGANIWPNAVLRGDYGTIHIGKNCSLQDNTVFHADVGKHVTLEDNVLVGHGAIVHGECYVCEYSMVGIHSTVLNGGYLGRGCLLGSGAVTTKKFDPLSLILGIPGSLKKKLEENSIDETKRMLALYLENSDAYAKKGIIHPHLDEFLDDTI